MDGWRDESECVCVCMHLYEFVDSAFILALLVLHKTAVIDDDTLSVLIPKTAPQPPMLLQARKQPGSNSCM